MFDSQTAIDLILDHYEHPRYRGTLYSPTFSGEGTNPGCGDVVRLDVRLGPDDTIVDIRFDGQGCTISQAAASILAERVIGRPLDEALSLEESALAAMMGEEIVRSRMACVSLGLRVLKSSGQAHRKNGG